MAGEVCLTGASAEQRRLANFVDFIGEGRGSQALAKALVETAQRVETLADEVDALGRSREKVFQAPPVEWVKDRLQNLQEVLQNRTARSAKTLRDLLAPIRLEVTTPDIGRPFYRAITTLDALALIETTSSAEAGSNSLQRRRWSQPGSNRRPPACKAGALPTELWPLPGRVYPRGWAPDPARLQQSARDV